jgi:hypothetical protein
MQQQGIRRNCRNVGSSFQEELIILLIEKIRKKDVAEFNKVSSSAGNPPNYC